jgi:serine/threonine-protein kinase
LVPGKSLSRSGNLKANSTVNYIIRGTQDQQLSTSLAGEGVLLSVLAPDQSAVSDQAVRVQRWEGKLPLTGEYTIQLKPVKGVSSSDYKLAMSLENAPKPTPTPTPTPTPNQPLEYQSEQVSIPGGVGSLPLLGQTSPRRIKRYLVNVQKGQQLSVEVPPGVDVSVDVRYPNGDLIPDASGAKFWQAKVPRNGEYMIDVIASKKTDYSLTVTVAK